MNRTNCCDRKNHGSQDCVCGICLEPLNNNTVELNCNHNHFYHKICIEEFIRVSMNRGITKMECPLCRRQFTQYGCNGKMYNVQKYSDDYDVEDEDEEPEDAWQRGNLSMYNQATGNRYSLGGKKYKRRKHKTRKHKTRKHKTRKTKSRKYHKR